MSMPGFGGGASLYVSARSYHVGIRALSVGAANSVVAQQGSGCTVSCADWIECNNRCGQWPPGFSNADCWIDCLAAPVNCLQSTCFPTQPSCDDVCADRQGCNKVSCLCSCEGGKLAPGGPCGFHCVDLP